MATQSGSPYKVKAGNYGTEIVTELFDRKGRVRLQGATIRFQMRQVDGDHVVQGDAEATDVERGVVRYVWKQGDLAVPGIYHAEWVVKFAAGTAVEQVDTWPGGDPDDYDEVQVLPSLLP